MLASQALNVARWLLAAMSPRQAGIRLHIGIGCDELAHLHAMFRIPVSRFYRNRDVLQAIGATILPTLGESALGASAGSIHCWSAGCASGEEPYTLLLIWHFLFARDWPRLSRDYRH